LIHVNPLPPGGSTKFFKLECNDEFKEFDKIIKVEFSRSTTCLLNWRLCCSGEGVLSWIYARSNDINFNNKIKGNMMLAIKIEKECKTSSPS
jgi:hypothetical protein